MYSLLASLFAVGATVGVEPIVVLHLVSSIPLPQPIVKTNSNGWMSALKCSSFLGGDRKSVV